MIFTLKQINVRTGNQAIEQAEQAVRSGDYSLDFSNVEHVDSTLLAVILAARRRVPAGSKLEILNPPAQMNSLVEAYGVQALFTS